MYQSFKNKLIAEFDLQRDLIVASTRKESCESLFGLRSHDDKLYSKILNEFERISIRNVEDLTIGLFEKYNIPYMAKNLSPSSKALWDLEAIVSGRKIKISFISSTTTLSSDRMHRYAHRIDEDDGPSYFVLLVKDNIAAKRNLERLQRNFNSISDNIFCFLFEDFLCDVFGEEEKNSFQNAMLGFKDDFRKIIGYQVTELCSEYNLNKLKNLVQNELLEFEYDSIRFKHFQEEKSKAPGAKDIYDKTFDTIRHEFIDNQKYKLLVSSADFSESFLSSEWLYKKYVALPKLDNTFIVAGYLKSIEQLLWDIIITVGTGKKIKDKVISKSNASEIDKTLGALEWFITRFENDDLYIDELKNGKRYVQLYLKNQIAEWRQQSRNGYFHKHVLTDIAKINTIRENTLYLYFLILGSIKLTPQDIKKITL